MANEKAANEKLAVSVDDLKDLIAGAVKAAVEESKKPYISDAEKKKTEQDQLDRMQQAELMRQMHDNQVAAQKRCTHEARDGHSHTVFVQDELGGYILCQKCQVKVRAGVVAKGLETTFVYDTDLFNRLFQHSSTSGIWE